MQHTTLLLLLILRCKRTLWYYIIRYKRDRILQILRSRQLKLAAATTAGLAPQKSRSRVSMAKKSKQQQPKRQPSPFQSKTSGLPASRPPGLPPARDALALRERAASDFGRSDPLAPSCSWCSIPSPRVTWPVSKLLPFEKGKLNMAEGRCGRYQQQYSVTRH